MYHTRAIKGRADYSKIIFWEFSAASNQERLQFEKYFLDIFLPQPFLNLWAEGKEYFAAYLDDFHLWAEEK